MEYHIPYQKITEVELLYVSSLVDCLFKCVRLLAMKAVTLTVIVGFPWPVLSVQQARLL